MFEVIRWVTLGVLWVCIILNSFALWLNFRGIRRNKQLCKRLKSQIEEWFRFTGHLD